MNRNSREFKSLQSKWYGKLKKSGFNDIEASSGMLKDYHSKRFTGSDAVSFSEKERYYQLAGQLLHTYPFPNATARAMWRMHAGGSSMEYISDALNLKIEIVARFVKKMEGHIKGL